MPAAAAVFVSFLLAVTLRAQTPGAAGVEPVLPPVVWELATLTRTGGQPLELAQPGRYSVRFLADGRLQITAGCRQTTGTYITGNGSVEVDLSDRENASCVVDPDGETFLELLAGARQFTLDPDGSLTLQGADGQLRLLPSLGNVVWEWQEFRGSDDSVIAPGNPASYTVVFLPGGKLEVLTGCVRVSGEYSVEGSALQLAVADAAGADCRPGRLAEQFLRDLDEVSSHVFRDGHLYLALRADAGIMEFAARYDEPAAATPQARQEATEPA